jgi:cytidine deaminase
VQTKVDRGQLIEAALSARLSAYAPYSKYLVGAAVQTKSGKIYTGANVENAAYPDSICAERVAIFKAVTDGERDFKAIAVATEDGGMPCGSCRQVLAEFSPNVDVIVVNEKGGVVHESPLHELLPGAFGPGNLNVKP